MMKILDEAGQSNWATSVKNILQQNGFGYVWLQQGVLNVNRFISSITQRLRDQYVQEWSMIISDSSKLETYTQYKVNFTHELYLSCVTVRKFRNALAKLRSSSHDLEIEKGRYTNVQREDRKCRICNTVVESEYHFLLKCPAYMELRQRYLPSKYYTNASFNKYVIIMSSRSESVLNNLAMFSYYAFLKRSTLLNEQ